VFGSWVGGWFGGFWGIEVGGWLVLDFEKDKGKLILLDSHLFYAIPLSPTLHSTPNLPLISLHTPSASLRSGCVIIGNLFKKDEDGSCLDGDLKCESKDERV